tara:strand:+ start:85 stop:315 length:231 start_codon:yes stop_codon:yes gene_type:complete
MSNWDRVMRGAYINGGWMIISESIVGVDGFDYKAPEAEYDWVIFCGGEHIGDKATLTEAKKYADAWVRGSTIGRRF